MFTLTSALLCLHKAISQERMPAKVFVHVWVQSYREEGDMQERERGEMKKYTEWEVRETKSDKKFFFKNGFKSDFFLLK